MDQRASYPHPASASFPVPEDVPPAAPVAPAQDLAPKAWLALAILTACFAFAFTDRQILNLMVDPMKRDFAVTDKQIGFLMGPAFTITYVLVGLFAGYCADRYNRRNLLLFAGTLWSLATVATAIASNYETMVVTRLIVGASEAFLFPSGMSLVAEMFDRRRLPIATTIYLTAPYIGGGLALIVGGTVIGYTGAMKPILLPIGMMHGWQVAIAIVGVLGAVPILALLAIPEPVRGALAQADDDMRSFGFLEGTGYMLKRWRFFVMFFLGISFVSILLNTVPAWAPTMFTRQYGMSATHVGLIYGILILVIGILAGLCSPAINRLIAKRHFDAPMRTVLIGPMLLIVFGALLLLAPGAGVAMACIALITFGYVVPLPMAGVSLQLATPPRLRGLSAAYYFVIVSVIGVGIGPMLVPFVTDNLLHDEHRLNTAIGMVTIACEIVALALLWCAFRGFSAERRAQGAAV
ncbi:MFS transporter [Sphingomonas immobilis]|uniref:MFS transporter n=1 Tax=Sphingomonas immobilis TaxID=3063997 RepID=A0ABT9A019_9SPHN|nr:MFS transporter [Sphingomonas sp. CA1-15]MDO7843175.1 MFS transporter [Sphingomonas sp. CA1-15]